MTPAEQHLADLEADPRVRFDTHGSWVPETPKEDAL